MIYNKLYYSFERNVRVAYQAARKPIPNTIIATASTSTACTKTGYAEIT